MPEVNGHYKPQLERIENKVDGLDSSIDRLSAAIEGLTTEFRTFISIAHNSIPIRAVFWFMTIIILGLVGVEGVKSLGPVLKSIFLF